MALKRIRGRAMWLLAGLAMGLLFGLGTTAGLLWSRNSSPAAPPGWPQGLPVHAATAASSETFAMSAGRIDSDVEGIFMLDFISGDLQCFVLNPRTGVFVGWFKANVTKELPVDKMKKPQYLLTTGEWSPAGGARAAGCVAYVADANTGLVAAYSFPWAKGAAGTGYTQSTPITPVGGVLKGRVITLRQE